MGIEKYIYWIENLITNNRNGQKQKEIKKLIEFRKNRKKNLVQKLILNYKISKIMVASKNLMRVIVKIQETSQENNSDIFLKKDRGKWWKGKTRKKE